MLWIMIKILLQRAFLRFGLYVLYTHILLYLTVRSHESLLKQTIFQVMEWKLTKIK